MVRPRDDLNKDDIIRRYQSGESKRFIADSLGVDDKTIARQLRLAGIAIRGHSEAGVVRATRDSPETKRKRIEGARKKLTGVPKKAEVRAKMAASKQARERCIGCFEHELGNCLAKRFKVCRQMAIGPYNIDLAVGKIAFEVHTSPHGPHLVLRHFYGGGSTLKERIDYLADRGWMLIYIWCPNGINVEDTEQIISLAERFGASPAVFRQHLVIRCHGDRFSTGSFNVQ